MKDTENNYKTSEGGYGTEGAYYESPPAFNKRGGGILKRHWNRGTTAFLVVAASIVFYFFLLRVSNLSVWIVKVLSVLQPVLYGFAIAYLLNPLVRKVDYYLVPVLCKKIKKEESARNLSRAIGIVTALVLMFILIFALLNMLIPELYTSIRNLVWTLPNQLTQLLKNINDIQLDDSTTGALLQRAIEEGSNMFMNWLRTDLMKQVNEAMGSLTEGVFTFLSGLFNFLIGIIVSIYILYSKEKLGRQIKRAIYAVFRVDQANMILHLTSKSNEIFGGFIIGKVIDSAIIGVLCFIGLSIMKIPYAVLVSVIIGTTNIIPFFGPVIGAVPSAVLIILTNPIKGIYFIIFVLVLQQFDGNILGPKILGNSTGLSAFGVITAILLGGGLFGFVGMVVGVPTMAVICYIGTILLEHLLEKKNLPPGTESYTPMSYVDSSGQYVSGEKMDNRGVEEDADKGTE